MKVLRFIALGLFLGVFAGGAKAAYVQFDFEIGFASGPLFGTTAQGSILAGDAGCPALVCNGLFAPAGPNLLKLFLTIDGTLFTAADDSLFPAFPQVTIANNVITSVDFATGALPGVSLFFDGTNATGIYADAGGIQSFIDVFAQVGNPQAVPEPATAALLGLGLLAGLGVRRQKRRASAAAAA